MKRNVKILSIFLFILSFSFVFTLFTTNVKAEYDFLENIDEESVGINGGGSVTRGGTITIKYEYGISEVLLYVEKCTNFKNKEKGVCDSNGFEPVAIIHRTGKTATNAWLEQLNSGGSTSTLSNVPSISISLSNYVNVGDVVRISAIYELAG